MIVNVPIKADTFLQLHLFSHSSTLFISTANETKDT